jgi:methylated-DNA-[protein]-cysteine S-methyltransferase
MASLYTQPYISPVGELILGVFDDELCLCDWRYRKTRSSIDKRIQKDLRATYLEQSHPLIDETIHQLEAYFRQERKVFDLPLRLVGSDFQKQIWQALMSVPYGQTSTYKQLASHIDNPDAVRAVANANGANALSIIVPCHRIVGSDGSLVGYAGGIKAKQWLLELEQGVLAPR